MRVLQLGMSWFTEDPGGIPRYYGNLFQYLPRLGVDLSGLVTGSAEVARQTAGKVTAFSPMNAPWHQRLRKGRAAIRASLAAKPCSLVASHFAPYTFPALDLVASYPLVIHFHGPWALESMVEEGRRSPLSMLQAYIERAVYRRGTRYIVLSEQFRQVLMEHYHIPGQHIHKIPGGVQTSQFHTGLSRARARELLQWPQDRPVVVAVRRLAKRMGLEDLIDAAVEIRKQVPDVMVIIAGKGELSQALEKRIAERDLAGTVRLVGFVADADLPLFYRAADLCIVPSVALEGFGLVVAEALAAGTPALVTPVGGLPEAVKELSGDLVLPGIGPGAIAAGVCSALNGWLKLPSAQACYEFARDRYDWAVITAAVHDVYRMALS